MKRMIDGTDRISLPRRFLRGERGTTAIEYSIVAAGIAMAVVGAIRVLGAHVLTDQLSQLGGLFGDRPALSPAGISCVPSASASRVLAEPGASGCGWLACGFQPESQTMSKVARTRPSGSPKRSA